MIKSQRLLRQAEQLIPLCAQTFSKSPSWFVKGVYPTYLQGGLNGHVWDVDGNEYIDFIMGLGAVSLGYCHPAVDAAIKNQLSEGINFSLPHPLEIELAELLHRIIPCADMVRFAKNGTDVTTAAVRLARLWTHREKVVYSGYHGGGSDWYGITTDRSGGIPKILKNYIYSFEYNDLNSLERLFNQYPDIACVIMEPTIFTHPEEGFLERVKEITHHEGALLIFDEMVTGFRMRISGAQGLFRVIPDLATFGKGIANGMPLSTLVGKREIMSRAGEIFFSYTFAGECLSLAAGIATIKEMQNGAIDKIWKLGRELICGLEKLGLRVIGYPCRFHVVLPDENQRSLFMQELLKRGILVHSSGYNICATHTESDIDRAIAAHKDALTAMASGARLEGLPIQPTFRRF